MGKKETFHPSDREAIARLLHMSPGQIKIDRFEYVAKFPDEIKAWKIVDGADPDLRQYQGKVYYPAAALIELIDLTTELLVKKRFAGLDGLPGLVSTDTRFRKPVMAENELLIQVKLLRDYKGRIGIFSGVIADRDGDIVAENISKGVIIRI
jgi:hypothetical protein